jgi:hypothetical protein
MEAAMDRSTDLLLDPPDTARVGSAYAYGRYRQPIPDPNLAVPGLWGRFRLKEWEYLSLTTDRFFVGFALVQLGYLANAFCYLVDRREPAKKHEYEAFSPLGLALRFAPSSVSGESRWERGRDRVVVHHDRGWEAEIDLPLGEHRLRGSFGAEPRESLALLFELPGRRPAYTHKAAALPARGLLTWGSERLEADGGLASLDWTRSHALRETRWKWAAFSGRARDGRSVGLNLSAEVYDDPQGDSRENALWVDGRVYPLGGVRFELPPEPARDPWRICSRSTDEVDLEFRPAGARAQRLNLLLLQSEFVEPYGTFWGRIQCRETQTPVEVDGVFGVVENHRSVW